MACAPLIANGTCAASQGSDLLQRSYVHKVQVQLSHSVCKISELYDFLHHICSQSSTELLKRLVVALPWQVTAEHMLLFDQIGLECLKKQCMHFMACYLSVPKHGGHGGGQAWSPISWHGLQLPWPWHPPQPHGPAHGSLPHGLGPMFQHMAPHHDDDSQAWRKDTHNMNRSLVALPAAQFTFSSCAWLGHAGARPDLADLVRNSVVLFRE